MLYSVSFLPALMQQHLNQTNLINVSYMPTFDLFFSAGYGRPGLDMLDDNFQPYYIAGIKMDWTIAGFYTGL